MPIFFVDARTGSKETPDSHVFTADLQGMRKEDLKIVLLGRTLEIRGKRRSETPDSRVLTAADLPEPRKKEEPRLVTLGMTPEFRGKRRSETPRNFLWRFRLPENAVDDAAVIKWSLKTGVLTITVPKKEEEEQPIEIPGDLDPLPCKTICDDCYCHDCECAVEPEPDWDLDSDSDCDEVMANWWDVEDEDIDWDEAEVHVPIPGKR